MRKNAWVICCCTAVLSAFGIFFRWLQNQACFEAETGLAVHGSIWPYVVALMIAVAAAVLAVVCFRVKNQPHTSFPDSLPAAFAASKRARAVGGVLLGAMLALGGLWLLLSSGALSEPGLQRVLAVLAVVTGVVFARQMLAPGERENDAGALVCASMPMVLLVFWLIVSYKVNIINPTISAYAVEILALCAALIAFYELAGFVYGRPKAVKSIFWSQFAAFLCITALPDDRAGAQQLMLVAIAGHAAVSVLPDRVQHPPGCIRVGPAARNKL